MNIWRLFWDIKRDTVVFGQVSNVSLTSGITTIKLPSIANAANTITIADTSSSVGDFVIIKNGKIEQRFTGSVSYFEAEV